MSMRTKVVIINISNYHIDKLTPYIEQLYKKDRINRFKFNDDKVRAIISEILVRIIYCESHRKTNDKIIFTENKFGKPYIRGEEDFKFNISHSKDLVVGVFDDEEIGVDIELIKELSIEVVRTFCSDNEYAAILKQNQKSIKELIMSIWVLKESYIKYLGVGLSEGVRSFDVINKKNIDPNLNLHKKKINQYILGICTKKHLDLNKCIEQLTIEDLIERYRKCIGI